MATIAPKTAEFINRLNEKFANIAEKEAAENARKAFEQYGEDRDYYKPNYTLTAEAGRKYDKVIINDTRVFLFMERSTGNIFKPASWKAPHTKHIRYTGEEMDQAIKDATTNGSFLRMSEINKNR